MDMLFIYGFDRSYTGLSVPVNQTVYLYRPGGRSGYCFDRAVAKKYMRSETSMEKNRIRPITTGKASA